MIDGQQLTGVGVFSSGISLESRMIRRVHRIARLLYRLLVGPF